MWYILSGNLFIKPIHRKKGRERMNRTFSPKKKRHERGSIGYTKNPKLLFFREKQEKEDTKYLIRKYGKVV